MKAAQKNKAIHVFGCTQGRQFVTQYLRKFLADRHKSYSPWTTLLRSYSSL